LPIYVQALVRLVLPARHRDAPVDVAGHRAGLDVLEDVLAEADHVGAPQPGRLALVEPAAELPGQGRQVQEPVRGLDELRGLAVHAGDGIDQVRGVQLVAAGVGLITARAGRAADRAGPLDVAVGQG